MHDENGDRHGNHNENQKSVCCFAAVLFGGSASVPVSGKKENGDRDDDYEKNGNSFQHTAFIIRRPGRYAACFQLALQAICIELTMRWLLFFSITIVGFRFVIGGKSKWNEATQSVQMRDF